MTPFLSYFFLPSLLPSRTGGTIGGTAVLGVTGDVGGRASGAELIECTARLWVCESVRFAEGVGLRVFVNVTDIENGSPAKKAD